MNKQYKAYFVLIALLLASIGIKYGVWNSNPFQQTTPTKLLFVTAMFCHVLASNADMKMPTIIITFHVSGTVACQTLLWIFLAELVWFCVINMLLLMVVWLCYFDYIANITHLIHASFFFFFQF
ncbi:hypothetical protein Fmac_014110 [Flemingia macrophylla]|uniref:Uncharacterized protein n=1 Tax=Flemingia macrophylla TaxID=520843 RepID=A0ABD1MBA7_9FABA